MTARQRILEQLFFGRDPLKDFPHHRFATDLQGWHSQHPYLARAIDEIRPALVVEVGVWKGASVVTMAKEIQRLKLDAVVIAIDTWLGSSEHYLWEKFLPDLDFEFGYPRLYHQFAANICKEGLSDYVVPLPLDSINGFQLLKARGIRRVGPDAGDLACGEVGSGRMAEPHDILNAIETLIADGTLKGLKALVTSGPTFEPIDPVRYIANRSSGKQGFAIAAAAQAAGNAPGGKGPPEKPGQPGKHRKGRKPPARTGNRPPDKPDRTPASRGFANSLRSGTGQPGRA